MSSVIVVQVVVGIFFMVMGALRIHDSNKSKLENSRNRHGAFNIAIGVAVAFSGISLLGLNLRWKKVDALTDRIAALEAQLAKQSAPVATPVSAEDKK